MSGHGHHSARGKVKVSYATRDAAVSAARRRYDEDRVRLWPYRCKKVRPGSVHPTLQQEHWHLTSQQPGTPRLRINAVRWHEEWNDELGARVVGCLLGENRGSEPQREGKVRQRAAAVNRRRGRCSSS